MEIKSVSQRCKATALQKSADSLYTKPKSLDLPMDEKYLISDVDVKEAMKKLTQGSVRDIEKPIPNEDSSCSVSGHRFYNWNTTHFYPDVHKLDIGILFRHNDKLSHLERHSRGLSDGEPESSSGSDCDNHKSKTKKDISKKMILTNSMGRHFAHGHIGENGLGVKIDIDLDSSSDSSDDDRGERWHKSPVRVRRIRRQDGRPLSAEINYDAASKKLYIHTLSKKLDAVGRRSLDEKSRGAKILRRQSAPSSEAYDGIRKSEKEVEKGLKGVSQNRFPVVANFNSFTSTDLPTKTKIKKDSNKQPNGLEDCVEMHDRRLNKEVRKEGKVANFHLLHQSRSQEDMNYGYPASCEQNVQSHSKQFGVPAAATGNPVNKTKFHSVTSNHFQPISNSRHSDIYKPLHQKANEPSTNQFLHQCGFKSAGQHIGNSSSFENIYDSLSSAPKKVQNENFEPSGRKFAKITDEPSSKHIMNDGFSKGISDQMPKEEQVLRPRGENQNNSVSKKSYIDAKTIVEEEKQKFRDYKIEYHRQLSGSQDAMSDWENSQKNDVSSQQLCSEDGIRQSSRFISPNDDHFEILRKLNHSSQNTVLGSEAKKANAGAIESTQLINKENKSDEGRHIREHQQKTEKQLCPTISNQPMSKAVQLPSEIYLDRHRYRSDASVVQVTDGTGSKDIESQELKAPSAFHRVTKAPESLTESTCFTRNPIQSRRPDLIPSPCIGVGFSSDTFSVGPSVAGSKDCVADSLPIGFKPRTMKSEPGLSSGDIGLLQKPPKPRKDEFSGNAEPKQWTYNTTYKPTLPSLSLDSSANITDDRNSLVAHKPNKADARNSAFTDVPHSNFPFPSSTSMNIFRSLPEQYRLSIQEPSSPASDSLVSKNESLYCKESGAGKQIHLHNPVLINELITQSLPSSNGKKCNVTMSPSAVKETYLADEISNSNNQRYDKAMVFSLTGFHVPKNSSEKEVNIAEKIHFDPDIQKRDVDSVPSFQSLNSDCLRQTQWTDAEKRRPVCWTDKDKRRPIVDWPDLDIASPAIDIETSPVETDYDKPHYNTRSLEQYLHSDSYERQNMGDLRSSAEYTSSRYADFASLQNYHVGVRSLDVSNLKDSESRRTLGSDPQVFYAVKFLPTEEPSFNHSAVNKRNEITIVESPLTPPRPFSRVPRYNADPFNLFDSQLNSQEQMKQSSGEIERPTSPSVLQNSLSLSNAKGTRSFSQPDVWKPDDNLTNFNTYMNEVPDCKYLVGVQQRQNLSYDNERNAFHNQSKASEEYEKHVNRSQESYKAKKIQSIEPQLNEQQPFANSLNLTPASLCFGEKSPNIVSLPKQKSALELHLSSSYGKHGGSPMMTPAEDCKKLQEPFNIEVDIRPPNAEDCPQVYDMSVRLSGSQEKMNTQNEEEVPQISVAAIKAKLFGQNEGKTQHLTGRQLAFQSDQNAGLNWAKTSNSAGNNKISNLTEKTQKVSSGTQSSDIEKLKDDERLYDYVSYKDGIKRKRSKINDHLTDFERVYEELDLDNHDDSDYPILHPSIHDGEFCPDSSNVKRLSITNLKLLTENQEKLAPNSNLEYTKKWIYMGKGHEPFHVTSDAVTGQARDFSVSSDYRNLSAKHVIPPVNYPRKQIDDMAYRKYGADNVKCARSDPDLPRGFIQINGGATSVSIEPAKSLSSIYQTDHSRFKESNKSTSGTMKKVELQTHLSSYQSPSYGKQLKNAMISRSPVGCVNQSVKQMQPSGTRVNLRQLQRSSSFESSSQEVKPEMQSPSCVGKLIELFEISQSAPNLTESVNFAENYEETGFANVTPLAKRQKTPKDVKLKNEKRLKNRPLKLNADSGYAESENDSLSSSNMEMQSLTTDFNLKSVSTGERSKTMDSRKINSLGELKQCADRRTDFGVGPIESPGRCEQVVIDSETHDERSKHMKKLREDFFSVKEDKIADRSAFGHDQLQIKKKPSLNSASETRTIVVLPSTCVGSAKSKDESKAYAEHFLLPSEPSYSSNSIIYPGNIKSLVSLDNPHSIPFRDSKEDFSKIDSNKGANLKTGLDLVKGSEIQKTTLNLNLLVPALESNVEKSFRGHISVPSVNPTCRGNAMTHNTEPHCQLELKASNQAYNKAAKNRSKQLNVVQIEKDEHRLCEEQLKSSGRIAGENALIQNTKGNETVKEVNNQKVKIEPRAFEANSRFGRTIHQPMTRSVVYTSQEMQNKRECFSNFDAQMTKQQTQTRSELVYKIEKRTEDDASIDRSAKTGDNRLESVNALCTAAPPSLLDRLEFSDGEMTDGTDVTLDAMVHFNQPRPSSPETLDFSDFDISSTSFSSKIKENQTGNVLTHTQVLQKSFEGSRITSSKSEDMAAAQTTWDSSSNRINDPSDQLAKVRTEMKLYRKSEEHKSKTDVLERRRSIKELVDSFEVMSSPFMRIRQKSSEVRSEDVERALVTIDRGRNTVD